MTDNGSTNFKFLPMYGSERISDRMPPTLCDGRYSTKSGMKILVYPEQPDFYDFAHRVYRDCNDWGHEAVIVVDPRPDPNFNIFLKVWYADETGIGIHYKSDRKDGIIYPGHTLKHLERLLYEETLTIISTNKHYC